MGPSVQNSSGVHWCRRRVRFNDVPEKVAKGPEKVWEALVQSQGDPEKVPGSLGAKPGSTGFRRTFQSGSGEGRGGFGGEPCHVQQGSGEGLGGFGAEPSQMQQGSGEGSGRLWCRARSWRSSMVPQKVPEKVPGRFGAQTGRSGSTGVRRRFRRRSGSTGFRRRFRRRSGSLRCRARSRSTGFRRRFRRRF